ncbi:MAG: hypothetical protein V4690_03835 [Patescibacteria group bacterium]
MSLLNTLKEGKYVNLWSVNHFLSGVVFAGWIFKIWSNLWLVFLMYFILALAWEVYEVYIGEFELFGNKIMDVVTGVLGFWMVYYFMILQGSISYSFVISSTILYIVLEIYLFVDYKRRRGGYTKDHQARSGIIH